MIVKKALIFAAAADPSLFFLVAGMVSRCFKRRLSKTIGQCQPRYLGLLFIVYGHIQVLVVGKTPVLNGIKNIGNAQPYA